MKKERNMALEFFTSGLTAFGILGLEMLLAFFIEPAIYGVPLDKFTPIQNRVHWIVIISVWLILSWILVRNTEKNSGYNPFGFDSMDSLSGSDDKTVRLIIAGVLVLLNIWLSSRSWGGIKIVKETQNKDLISFVLQIVYYFAEMVPVYLMVSYGHRFFESLMKKESVLPLGGIFLLLTWGLGHIFSKGLVDAVMYLMIPCLIFGMIYVLCGKKGFLPYFLMALAFII